MARTRGAVREINHVYWCCKGRCDHSLKARYQDEGLIDGWEDIPDVLIPVVYLKWVMAFLNQLRKGYKYSDEAFEKTKHFLVVLFQHVSREPTSAGAQRVGDLLRISEGLGGLG